MTENSKILTDRQVSFDYLRVTAVVMILYDHLGGLRNSGWIVKRGVDFIFATPLNIIQDFGAFGVSIFFVISGYLFARNGRYENVCSKNTGKILKIYLSSISAFLGFLVFQNIVWMLRDTYWRQFTAKQWVESLTLAGYFTGNGDVINGTTWFLLPLFFFYMIGIIYGMLYEKTGGGAKSLYVIEVLLAILFWILHLSNAGISSVLVFVYMPVSGVILAELVRQRENRKAFLQIIGTALINYVQMVVCFHRFYAQYYYEEKYLVSFSYAVLLVVICLLFDSVFEEKSWCRFLCSISLSVYLLQMTWGGFFMQVFVDHNIPFTVAFILTVCIITAISWFHSKYIENKILKKLIGNLMRHTINSTSKSEQ